MFFLLLLLLLCCKYSFRHNSFTIRNEMQTARFSLELICNVKSCSHRHEFHFAYIDPTPNGIFLEYISIAIFLTRFRVDEISPSPSLSYAPAD